MIVLLATNSGQLVNSVMTAVFCSPSGPGGNPQVREVHKGVRKMGCHELTAIYTDDEDPYGIVHFLIVDSDRANDFGLFQPVQWPEVSRVVELVPSSSHKSVLCLNPEAVLVNSFIDWKLVLTYPYILDPRSGTLTFKKATP